MKTSMSGSTWRLLIVGALSLMGAACSRARVESLDEMNQGVALAQSHRPDEAYDHLERATSIDPTNDLAFYNLSIVYMQTQKWDRAKEAIQKAISVKPDSATYQDKLGTILVQMSDYAGAKVAFGKALELDGSLFKASYKLAQMNERLDDPQEALVRYTEAIQKGPRFLEAYAELGRLYADLGFLDQSVQVLESGLQVAIEGSEEAANVHQLLGTVYQQQRKFDDAIREFQAALKADPTLDEALFSLGWAYAIKGDRSEAKRYLERYVGQAGQEAPASYMKAARDKLSMLSDMP